MNASLAKQDNVSSSGQSPVKALAKRFESKLVQIEKFDNSIGSIDFDPAFFTPPQTPIKSPKVGKSWKIAPCGYSTKAAFMTPKQSPEKVSSARFTGTASFLTPSQSPAKAFSNNARFSGIHTTKPVHDEPSPEKPPANEKEDPTPAEAEAEDHASTPTTEYSESESDEEVITKTYPVWDFGKKHKSFTPPPVNKKTTKAAIQIQRIARGGWQRIQYKIALLQDKLDRRSELTALAIDKVWQQTEVKKKKYFDIVKTKADAKSNKKLSLETAAAQEGHQVIDYLRRDNKKLRSKNDSMAKKMLDMHKENKHLESVGERAAKSMEELQTHVERFKDTHDQLVEVMPMYEHKTNECKDAVELRTMFCVYEHKMKVMFMKAVGEIVQMMEDRYSRDPDLVEEIVAHVFAIGENQ